MITFLVPVLSNIMTVKTSLGTNTHNVQSLYKADNTGKIRYSQKFHNKMIDNLRKFKGSSEMVRFVLPLLPNIDLKY